LYCHYEKFIATKPRKTVIFSKFLFNNILIIDDNPGNIDFLLGLLTEYDISAAVDGERALDQISQEIPDLILLDVSMPGMDGYEVCSIIKSNPETKDIPVLFLSANTDAESIVKGFDVGGVDYITKPYRPREVLARVETHLKLKQLRDELEKMAYEDPMTGIVIYDQDVGNDLRHDHPLINLLIFDRNIAPSKGFPMKSSAPAS